MNEDFVSFDLAKKLKEKGFNKRVCGYYLETGGLSICNTPMNSNALENEFSAPTVSQVLKWLRKGENIDVEIHAESGMLGNKVYVPFISTYTEFTLGTSPDVIRYRQKKFNPTQPLPHEIVPAHVYFKEWEEAAIAGIEYVIDNLV